MNIMCIDLILIVISGTFGDANCETDFYNIILVVPKIRLILIPSLNTVFYDIINIYLIMRYLRRLWLFLYVVTCFESPEVSVHFF